VFTALIYVAVKAAFAPNIPTTGERTARGMCMDENDPERYWRHGVGAAKTTCWTPR
jgi:hypothetical protein